jgi:transposase
VAPRGASRSRALKDAIRHLLNYLNHRITNAVAEGLNAKIQWIKHASRGFRDRERFKVAISFHGGRLRSRSPMRDF